MTQRSRTLSDDLRHYKQRIFYRATVTTILLGWVCTKSSLISTHR